MAFRFRRTMKIAPGVRLNLTKTGVSARVGPRGAGVTVGTSGTTVSAGIPGSGLHVSEKITRRAKQTKVQTAAYELHDAGTKLGFFGWVGVATVTSLIVWGVLALLG
ncbi:uncharacterized protein DUF4236 [Roseinatronobacter thiooxidans]|uniref:Uncharacterized protein DUF4236 n=1 Tax=Roseinatronobacter thiooxidans TaxID=121821 RepID=A0A2W7QQJ3_9RHOB|nr:uncharacterized protein DUF4236 [Roseinatronobacter thiooxidans]